MPSIKIRDFLSRVKELRGKTLSTLGQEKRYRVHLDNGEVEFEPLSDRASEGENLTLSQQDLEEALEKYNKTGSRRTEDYGYGASYFLPIIERIRQECETNESTEAGIDPDSIDELAETLNRRAEDYEIGDLQQIRKDLQGLQRRPHSDIFTSDTIIQEDGYAFHYGGRDELQFNVALVEDEGEQKVRYGVGFSLQLSPSMTDTEDVRSRIAVFNEYLSANSGAFRDLWMWHYPDDGTGKSIDYLPGEIPNTLLREGVFIFLGKRGKPSEISYDEILETFERLLPLYVYIEENVDSADPDAETVATSGTKQPERKHETTAIATKTEVDVKLRHNRIQDELQRKLSEEYGVENVEAEYPSEYGRVDLVVETGDSRDFYEIKPYSAPRLCIREAVGQLLEYAYWSGSEEPDRLVVVGESKLDEEGKEYLLRLWEKFGLPIEYERFSGG